MQRQFVHLHLHTDCSFLEGACPVTRPGRADSAERRRYGDLVTLALEHNSPAVAMTDSNSMGGAVEFYEALRAVNVKPIIGCEIQVAPPDGRGDGPGDPPVSGYPLKKSIVLETRLFSIVNLRPSKRMAASLSTASVFSDIFSSLCGMKRLISSPSYRHSFCIALRRLSSPR